MINIPYIVRLFPFHRLQLTKLQALLWFSWL